MIDYFEEMMLRSDFVAENAVGRFVSDKRALFFTYADIFLVPQDRAEYLFALSRKGEVTEIKSLNDFYRYQRLKQYSSVSGLAYETDAETDDVITLKGAAFTMATAARIPCNENAGRARSEVCQSLTESAESGYVLGLYTLGILESEGIVFSKVASNGLKKLKKAADWNSTEGLLAALYYDPDNREKYLECLRDGFARVGCPELFETVRKKYGPYIGGKHSEYLLLEKVFGMDLEKRDRYNKSVARIVKSAILPDREKEKILLSQNRESFAEVSALPLKLGKNAAELKESEFAQIRPDHPEESGRIVCELKNADLRTMKSSRPLCIVSDSRFMLDYYAAPLSRCFENAHVERIDVAALADYDSEPTYNNVFVRSCDEDAFNLYLLVFCGEISGKAFETAKNFLQTDKRKQYRLVRPGVTLDLSSIYPVCLCDRENAKKLSACCETVRVAEVTSKEKQIFVEKAVQNKGIAYGVRELTMRKGLAEKLCREHSLDQIDSAIDAAVREHRAQKLCLTEELLIPYMKNNAEKTAYGFGGDIHEY